MKIVKAQNRKTGKVVHARTTVTGNWKVDGFVDTLSDREFHKSFQITEDLTKHFKGDWIFPDNKHECYWDFVKDLGAVALIMCHGCGRISTQDYEHNH